MRQGNNPLRRAEAPEQIPHEIMTVITHLPILRGYHADRLEVVQICLKTMRTAGVPVMVWDNGSCEELRRWIRMDYQPDYFIESPNIGKKSARACMMRMFPADTIFGCTDDDMFFYPGWWKASVDLLKTFAPKVAIVSAWPVRVSFNWANLQTYTWAKENAKVTTGRFISAEEEDDYATSVGILPNEHRQRTAQMQDVLIDYHGIQAYATAQHCQFITYAGRVEPYMRWDNMAMGGELDLDADVDKAGILRLTTTKRYALHMGNMIEDKLRAQIGVYA